MARTVHPSKLRNASRSFSRQPRHHTQQPEIASAQPAEGSRAPRASTSRSAPAAQPDQTSRPRKAKVAPTARREDQPTEKRRTRARASRESDKKRGKRKVVELDDAEGTEDEGDVTEEGDDDYLADSGDGKVRARSSSHPKPKPLVERFSRPVSRQSIAKSWRPLSYSATLSMRDTTQQSALYAPPSGLSRVADVLGRLQLKDRAIVQGLLSRIEAQIDGELSLLVVPSSGFLSRPAGAADGARQVELLEEADMRQRILSWDQARVQENDRIRKLKKAIKAERTLLEEDEARLASFEDARLRVEKKEQKDMARALHPLVSELVAAAATRDKAGRAGQLGRAEAGRRWVAEAARVDDVKPKRLPGGDDSEEEVEEEYDAARDPYLVELRARLAGPLNEVERAVAGLARVRGVVDGAERAVIGLM